MAKGVHPHHLRGADHPRWRGGIVVASNGYIKVFIGKGQPLADPNGYAYEHRIVAQSTIGRPLTAADIVHHINGDQRDNRPENLRIMTRAQHNRYHNLNDRGRDPRSGRLMAKSGGVTPEAGGRLLDGRVWDEMPAGALVAPKEAAHAAH